MHELSRYEQRVHHGGDSRNDDDGVGDCSKLSLAAGTHTLAVRHYSSTATGSTYALTLKP